ncbi:MAG: 16S rRNA (cytosine(1402)-N(4))-methyltransferase [Candidatus Saccharimonadales bacterium]
MVKEAHHHNNSHVPVLLEAVLDVLAPQSGETYLDLTAGYGGHASAIREITGNAFMTLVDRDSQRNWLFANIERAGRSAYPSGFSFGKLPISSLQDASKQFDMILLDLGALPLHLTTPSADLVFKLMPSLTCEWTNRQEPTAHIVVNEYSGGRTHESFKGLRRRTTG